LEQSRSIGGAGLDVFTVKPLPADSPLCVTPDCNAIATTVQGLDDARFHPAKISAQMFVRRGTLPQICKQERKTAASSAAAVRVGCVARISVNLQVGRLFGNDQDLWRKREKATRRHTNQCHLVHGRRN